MATKNQEIEIVAIDKIMPDPEQPRKNFDPSRLADLIASIRQHGIRSPLHVEKIGDKYILEDGERRYRAAKELKLKEVPVIVNETKSGTDRLIIQFHLQEQHEGWTPTEKATAVRKLAEGLNLSVKAMGKLLSLPERTVSQYQAFADLIERKEFEKSEISIAYADNIVAARKFIKGIFEKNDMEFDKENERDLERTIISRIKSGDIARRIDINKIRDAAKSDPKAILAYIKDDKMTTQKLFLKADAKVAYHYRNMIYSARAMTGHILEGEKLDIEKLLIGNSTDIAILRKAIATIEGLIGKEK